MAKIAYTAVPENDFSLGIDARSAENQIAPGFVKDLLNADIVEKRARKRQGYQGFAGNIPIRITQLEYDDAEDMICFVLPEGVSLESSGISLENTPSSPIVVYGRSSLFTTGQGPFITTADNVKYYDKFTVPIRKQLTAPGGTLTFSGTEHGLGTTNMFIGIVESDSMTNRSYTDIITDAVRIDEITFDVSIDYTTTTDREVFIYFVKKETVTGDSYVHAELGVPSSASPYSFTIPAATHSLSDFNIITSIQEDTGTERLIVDADSVSIATNGDVTVTLTNNTGSPHDYYVILSATPVANSVSGTINALSTGTVTISSLTSPWAFYGIYLSDGITNELVMPDSLVYDDTTKQVTLTFTNNNVTARTFTVFYEYGNLRSNILCVEDASITTSGTDTRPQITIWGLEHNEIYPAPKSEREGWANHIDSYRRSGEQRLICGLGGNLFSARTYTEAATQYAYPQLYPKLNARTSTNYIVGPLIWATGDTPGRTRGYLTADSDSDHWGSATAVEYDTGTGWTKYTISLPNKAILDSTGAPTSLASVISTTTNLEDYLTVQQMSYARHEGTFRIRQVQDGTDEIFVWVENDSNSSDYDDDGTAGEVGIFTDQLGWSTSGPYVLDDRLLSDAIADTLEITAISSDGTVTVSTGWVDLVQIPGGVLFLGLRSSDVIPLRDGYPSASSSTTNLVRGDMLSYSGPDILNSLTSTERLFRVLSINPDSDRSVNISASAGVATVTLLTGDTSYLSDGNKVFLVQAGVYSGAQEILDVTSTTQFTFSTEETDSVSGSTLLGETAQIDEELSWQDTTGDTNFFTVEDRWIPIEAPDDSFDLTPFTYISHFDVDTYVNQAFLRSTMVTDNMYFTNSDDEVFKFDGSSVYRSGIMPWQPGLFLTQELGGAPGAIVTGLRNITYSASLAGQGQLTILTVDAETIPVGASIRLSGSTESYTVRTYTQDPTTAATSYLLVDRALDASVSAAGTANEIGVFRYYYRLNAVDANNNIIASAVTGYQDHVMELIGDAAIRHKIVGLPAWDIYDYDRLEVQIYRTKMNTPAPFYRITTLPMNFNNSTGYLRFLDSFSDDDLTDLDEVNTALKGSELGTAWSDPLRAKYVTSIGNRKVLGNIRDYPQLDIQIVADATVSNTSFANDDILFRRDHTDIGTTTDNVNRIRYQWKNGVSGTTSSFTTNTTSFSFNVSGSPSLAAGNWIYLTYLTVGSSARLLEFSGWWQIASYSGSTVTVKLTGANLLSTAFTPNRYVIATDTRDVPVLLGTDGNLGMVNGDSFDVFDATRRMAMAINTTMRMADVTISGQESFIPWLTARSGNDTPPAGHLIVRQPRSDALSMEMVPTFSGYSLFVNSIGRTTGDQIGAVTRVYPSRIIASYENYAEIFDNPTSILDVDSDSAIDVNSADGQEITGIIPFFGETAFTAAQQAAVLVVFKTNSVYLVDLNQKKLGNQAIQRIETEGLGCTAPYSIASTKAGISFANESGIYCLRRTQAIEYLGKFMERNWLERVDLDALAIAQGHHFGIGRAYKLSVPLQSTVDTTTGYIENSEVYVYNHTGEEEGRLGAWGRYDNHPATGWANLASDAYFSSTGGRVFSLRQTGQLNDFRDDHDGIDMELRPRHTDFGVSGIRKVVDGVVVDYRVGARNTGTSLNYSPDLEQEYANTTPFIVDHPPSSTNLSDPIPRDIMTIRHDVGRRRCVYFGVEILNGTIDENVEISGISYKVGGLTDHGILTAARTR